MCVFVDVFVCVCCVCVCVCVCVCLHVFVYVEHGNDISYHLMVLSVHLHML